MKTGTLIDIFENVSNKNKNDLIVFFENLNGMNNFGKKWYKEECGQTVSQISYRILFYFYSIFYK